jgi:hypothetical protein
VYGPRLEVPPYGEGGTHGGRTDMNAMRLIHEYLERRRLRRMLVLLAASTRR